MRTGEIGSHSATFKLRIVHQLMQRADQLRMLGQQFVHLRTRLASEFAAAVVDCRSGHRELLGGEYIAQQQKAGSLEAVNLKRIEPLHTLLGRRPATVVVALCRQLQERRSAGLLRSDALRTRRSRPQSCDASSARAAAPAGARELRARGRGRGAAGRGALAGECHTAHTKFS